MFQEAGGTDAPAGSERFLSTWRGGVAAEPQTEAWDAEKIGQGVGSVSGGGFYFRF